jgi:hypothetical protein
VNPYIIFDQSAHSKKAMKKKSESIDLSKKKASVSLAAALLRQSIGGQNNNSMLDHQWLMTSADSE